MCVSSWNSSRLGGQSRAEQAAKSSAAPQSLRTRCSSLLAAMKSNQSPACSPGLTSAFNYRTQRQQRKSASAGPQASVSQPPKNAGLGVDAAGLCIQWPDINTSVLKHTAGPDGLSGLLHRLGQSQGASIL